jgi:alcohol dehydrogenase class IV
MWFFNSPRIFFGKEAIEQLSNPLNIAGSKAFVVTDKDIVGLGIIDIVTKQLKAANIEYTIFDGVLPDPPISVVKEAASQCQEFAPDLIIALGGGSVIDCAKGAWILYEDPTFELPGLNPFVNIPTGTKAKLVAIPTTSGTGAETTGAVVLTDDETGLKLELLNRFAIPTVAIVDPVFVDKMPKKLITSTGFDAVAHCIEGSTGQWRNIYTEGLATVALGMLFKFLPDSFAGELEAREQVHNAASIAGLSFGNAQVHLGHTIGHALGGTFHIPHGFAVGMALPYVMQFLVNHDDQSKAVSILSRIAKATGRADWGDDDATAAAKLIAAVKELQSAVEFPATLTEYGLNADDVEAGIPRFKELALQSGCLTITPVDKVDAELAANIVRCMIDGSPVEF